MILRLLSVPAALRRLSLALPLCAGLCLPVLATASESLLPHSSLEEPNGAGSWAQGWPNAKNVTWEQEDGNRFFRLKSAEPGTQVTLYVNALIPRGVQALELTFRGRVTGLERGSENWHDARVILNFKDEAGKKTAVARLPYFSKDTDGWVTKTLRFKVPENAVALEVMPTLFRVSHGEFDIDDIVLKPIDAASL